MTADVTTSDRRVTVPTLGIHTAFVDGSRLFWALPSLVHEGLGYRVLVPDRIQGDAVLPHASFTAQSKITSHRSRGRLSRSSSLAPCSPSSRRGLAKPELAASRRATANLDEGCARRSRRITVGTKKRARSNKETDSSTRQRSPPCLPLDSQPHTRVGKGAERRAHQSACRRQWWARFALPTLLLHPSQSLFAGV